MVSFFERVTIFCFAASYGLALALELGAMFRPRPVLRAVAIAAGIAGLFAQTLYLSIHVPTLVSPTGSLLFLALVLAVFYVYGSIHHRRLAWGLFVLPLVLGLIGLAVLFPEAASSGEGPHDWSRFWGMAHGILLLLAAVGVCVGFLASVMYLVQIRRLRDKVPPGQGVRLLNLERLEAMNRRAILTAFPLLTVSIAIGLVLQAQHGAFLQGWDSLKLLSTFVLWVVFALLLYLRFWAHVRGRQAALLTVVAFVLLLVALAAPTHNVVQGGSP